MGNAETFQKLAELPIEDFFDYYDAIALLKAIGR
jgi:hypothetical protein